jgi:hypothetical protein
VCRPAEEALASHQSFSDEFAEDGFNHGKKDDALMFQVYLLRGERILTNAWQPLEQQLGDMADKNQFGLFFVSLVGQKMGNDSQCTHTSVL